MLTRSRALSTLVALALSAGCAPRGPVAVEGSGPGVPSPVAPWSDPLGLPDTLRAVDAIGDVVVAVGDAGAVLVRRGGSWTLSRVASDDLFDVWAAAPDEWWALGDHGTIVRFSNGAWQRVAAPTDERLLSVRGTARDDVIASGADGTLLHWDGAAWSAVDSGSHQPLPDVERCREDALCALVDASFAEVAETANGREAPVETSRTLVLVGGRLIASEPGDGFDIAYVKGKQLTVSRGSTAIVGVDTPAPPIPGHAWRELDRVWTDGADARWLVGAVGYLQERGGRLVLDGGAVWEWGGDGWRARPEVLRAPLQDVVGVGPSEAIAVGDAGLVARWDGQAWHPEQVESHVDDEIRALWVPGDGPGLAVSRQGRTWEWRGSAWQPDAVGDPPLQALSGAGNAVFGGGACGAAVRRDADRWAPLPLGYSDFPADFDQVAPQFGGYGPGNPDYDAAKAEFDCDQRDVVEAIWAASPTDAWFVGSLFSDHATIRRWDGTALRRVDGPSGGTLFAVHGSRADDVWAVGNGRALHWDGAAWSTGAGVPRDVLLRAVWSEPDGSAWAAGFRLPVAGPPTVALLRFDGQAWSEAASFEVPGGARAAIGPSPRLALWRTGATLWLGGPGGLLVRGLGGAWEVEDRPTSVAIEALGGPADALWLGGPHGLLATVGSANGR